MSSRIQAGGWSLENKLSNHSPGRVACEPALRETVCILVVRRVFIFEGVS